MPVEDTPLMLPANPPKYSGEEGMPQEAYSWEKAVSDLALLSHLTLKQSSDLLRPLELSNLFNPYDAMPVVRGIVNALKENSYEEAGRFLQMLPKSCSEVVRSTSRK